MHCEHSSEDLDLGRNCQFNLFYINYSKRYFVFSKNETPSEDRKKVSVVFYAIKF